MDPMSTVLAHAHRLLWALCIVAWCADASKRGWFQSSNFISGSLPPIRYAFGMTSSEGIVYISGGYKGTTILDDLHRFNPTTLTWTELSGNGNSFTPPGRFLHSIVIVKGKILMHGGFSGATTEQGILGDLHEFDLSTLTWTPLTVRGDVPPNRCAHGFTATADGRVYVFGGLASWSGAVYNDLYELDTATLTWTDLTPTAPASAAPPERRPLGRYCFGFQAVGGGLFLFGGGYGSVPTPPFAGSFLNDVHMFNLTSRAWVDLSGAVGGDVSRPRTNFPTAVVGTMLYVSGGIVQQPSGSKDAMNDVLALDTSTLTWINLTPSIADIPSDAKTGHGLAAVGDRLFIFGGADGSTTKFVFLNSLHAIDLSVLEWTNLNGVVIGAEPNGRYNHGFTSTGGKVYVFGGYQQSGLYAQDLHSFNPYTLKWEDLTSKLHMATLPAIAGHGFTNAGGFLYSFGGALAGGTIVNHFYKIDPSNGVLTNLTVILSDQAAPPPRYMSGLVTSGEKLFTFGGAYSGVLPFPSKFLGDFFEFDISTQSWTNITDARGSQPSPRASHGFVAVGSKILVFGGVDFLTDQGVGNFLDDMYQYDTSEGLWTELTGMTTGNGPSARYGCAMTLGGNKVFLFGGNGPNGADLGDLFQYDPLRMQWTELTSMINGSTNARSFPGMVSVSDKLIVFGGRSLGVVMLGNLQGISFPKEVTWPGGTGLSIFIEYYDWDQLHLDTNRSIVLITPLSLCSGILPCFLSVVGSGAGTIRLVENSYVSCLASSGCTGVNLNSLTIVCDNHIASQGALRVSGSVLDLKNTVVLGCRSQGDGGAIQAFDGAEVSVTGSVFQGLSSESFGGAISVVGSTLTISYCTFVNCFAAAGGGTISAFNYECYGSDKIVPTTVRVEWSTFKGSSTGAYGGSILVSGDSVNAMISHSSFVNCTAALSGGAISVEKSARANIFASNFENNSAYGVGGGALYSQYSMMVVAGASCNGNTAFGGGGGALYWTGSVEPEIRLWCGAGSWASSKSKCTPDECKPSCSLCQAGTYQTGEGMANLGNCTACTAGKFSTTVGATSSGTCISCLAGTFSTALGVTACSDTRGSSKISIIAGDGLNLRGEQMVFGTILNQTKPTMNRKAGQTQSSNEWSVEHERNAFAPLLKSFVQASHNGPVMCGTSNAAAYGPCLATTYRTLEVTGLPTYGLPAYPGLTFSPTVMKKDFYGQTIVTDSESLVQTLSTIGSTLRADSSVSISGFSVASLLDGAAFFSIVIKPTFIKVQFQVDGTGITILERSPQIYIKGIDSETLVSMQSDVFDIVMSNGSTVCPSGYILVLDQSSSGSCSLCGPGTYSVYPLAGITLVKPSCLTCPASGDCRGGNHVNFSLGTWIVSEGQYRLVACPAGHQLINSINNVFAHDVQDCRPCLATQYILNSSNPKFSCQPCPAGAMCNGSSLQGLVDGSVWATDMTAGVYRLVSCPAGYELISASQTCLVCAAAFYCVGGSSGRTACPAGYFAQPGASNLTGCTSAVLVEVSVSLPISKSDFTEAMQLKFQASLAAASGVSPGMVVLVSITQATNRRSRQENLDQCECECIAAYSPKMPEFSFETQVVVHNLAAEIGSSSRRAGGIFSIIVLSQVAAADTSAAAKLKRELNSEALNSKLLAAGLPQGTVQTVNIPGASAEGSAGVPLGLVVGPSVGGFVFILILLFGGSYLFRKVKILHAQQAFLTAFRTAKAGDQASHQHLPYGLGKHFVAKAILGRGAFGCVVLAERRDGGDAVAIKVVIPERGSFDDKERRQLIREANVLKLFTSKKCEHAVQLAGSGAVHLEADMCWFIMELAQGDNMETIIKDTSRGPIRDVECIKVARSVLAALKVMHADGLVHRDIKPANIVRCVAVAPTSDRATATTDEAGYSYKLVDFGTALGVDETVAKEVMMTLATNRQMGAGTPPYMSPEMFKEPEKARYPTDLWSLGVSLFEMATGVLPFVAETDLLWSAAIAGNMEERAPLVLDRLEEDRRALFDNNLAKVIAHALEKHTALRYQTADEMHEAVYSCLIVKGEAFYSVFISYRVASEAPLARLLFDDLNHSVTPGGHRVTVYWDAHRLVKGEDWEEGFANGLLNSLCIFPLLSYGSTAPMAALPADPDRRAEMVALGWDEEPVGRRRLEGSVADPEDNVLKEFLIAAALLERRAALATIRSASPATANGSGGPANGKGDSVGVDGDRLCTGDAGQPTEKGLLQAAYPILIGRQEPPGHPDYPRMGKFFAVQGGGGQYPQAPSPATSAAVGQFLTARARLPQDTVARAARRTVAAAVQGLTALQGCRLWDHSADLAEVPLSKGQRDLIGKGFGGPGVDLDGVALTAEQREACLGTGLDERQLCMLKAQVQAKRHEFHEVIDRAVGAHERGAALGVADASSRRSLSVGGPVFWPAGGVVMSTSPAAVTASAAATVNADAPASAVLMYK